MFGVWRKTRPSHGALPSPRGGRGFARGLEGDAGDRTAAGIPRDKGRKDRRGEVRGLSWPPRRCERPGRCPSTLRGPRRGHTPLFPSAQLAPDEWTRGFETEPASTGGTRPAGRERRPTRGRTPGNFPDTESRDADEFFGTPASATRFRFTRASFRRAPRTDEEARATGRDGRAGETRRTRRRMRTRRSSRGELTPPGPDPPPVRSDGRRRSRGCPATTGVAVGIAPRPRHHRGPSAV